jgi:transcriptional regulator with XRE-family HTH domain
MVIGPVNALRRLRLELSLTQNEFPNQLGVTEETYRTWDSGRRRAPRRIVYLARRLNETDSGKLLALQVLASEYHVHVRTLRKPARVSLIRRKDSGSRERLSLRRSDSTRNNRVTPLVPPPGTVSVPS